MLDTIAFYFFAILTLSMALVVITTKNILYAMSALAVSMVFVAAFFFLLNAQFLGVVQILVYVGAVIVMYAFGMMFFNASEEVFERTHAPKLAWFLAGGVGLVLVLALGAPAVNDYASSQAQILASQYHATQDLLTNPKDVPQLKLLGYALFGKYLVVFEAGGLMLLVALVGGIASALRKSHLKDEA